MTINRAQFYTGELNVVIRKSHSILLTGCRGARNANVLLQKCKVPGCNVIGLQGLRRPGRTEFVAQAIACSVAGRTGEVIGLDSMGLGYRSRSLSSSKLRGHRTLRTSAWC